MRKGDAKPTPVQTRWNRSLRVGADKYLSGGRVDAGRWSTRTPFEMLSMHAGCCSNGRRRFCWDNFGRTIVSSFLRGKGRAPITPSNACLDR
jgi:hypothetical protein